MSKAKSFHRWAGLILGPLLILFAVSGIILNHKSVFDKIPISRRLLPKQYKFTNWNNQLIAGSLPIAPDSILLFSKNGALLSDSLASRVIRLEYGLPNRLNRINDAIKLPNGSILAALPEGLFALRCGKWTPLARSEDPLVSLTHQGDTLFAISRSALYIARPPYSQLLRRELPPSVQHEKRIPLFRIFWDTHSGAIFGLPGRLFVDLLGLVMIALSSTGIAFFFNRRTAKALTKKHRPASKLRARLRRELKNHTRLGRLIFPLLLLVATGTFLRPPLLIPIAYAKVTAPRGTSLYSRNPWHNRLRKIAYDAASNHFLLSSTDCFFLLERTATSAPQKVDPAPPVSVMGCNVLQQSSNAWLIGSFSGLYRWQSDSGLVIDLSTGKPYIKRGGMPTFGGLAAAGYSADFPCGPIVFDYNKGAQALSPGATTPPMPAWLEYEPISLWNVALEIHTGRIYSALLGPVTPFFIFIMGSLTSALLLVGWRRSRASRKGRSTALHSKKAATNSSR